MIDFYQNFCNVFYFFIHRSSSCFLDCISWEKVYEHIHIKIRASRARPGPYLFASSKFIVVLNLLSEGPKKKNLIRILEVFFFNICRAPFEGRAFLCSICNYLERDTSP
jgi:hypothetical protein